MKQKTVWRDEGRKWKPRNLQAAKALFPAHGMNLPPEEKKDPVFAESHTERFARERKERDERIAILNAENERVDKEHAQKRAAKEAKRWRRKLLRFKKKQAAKIERVVAKVALKIAPKSPIPTT